MADPQKASKILHKTRVFLMFLRVGDFALVLKQHVKLYCFSYDVGKDFVAFEGLLASWRRLVGAFWHGLADLGGLWDNFSGCEKDLTGGDERRKCRRHRTVGREGAAGGGTPARCAPGGGKSAP